MSPPNLDRMRKVNRNDTMPSRALRIPDGLVPEAEAWNQLGMLMPQPPPTYIWATGDPHRS